MAMVATPIFINTFVVFVRLYWFERRFQHVVREARNLRRSRSRTKTELKNDLDLGRAERGVDGRDIVVLHDREKLGTEGANNVEMEKSTGFESESPASSSMTQGELAELRDQPGKLLFHQTSSFHRDLAIPGQTPSQESLPSQPLRLPQRSSPEQHLAFLQNQRNPKDKGTLRIPGPREFDRGDVPEHLNLEGDDGVLSQQVTSPTETKSIPNGHQVRRRLTIEEPDHPRSRADTGTFSRLTRRRTGNSDQNKATATDDGEAHRTRLRHHGATIHSLGRAGSKENVSIPYLSWQPTIGRNSAFVDLTEEQREELGGIEYRSLKTLAAVLVCKLARFQTW